MSANDPSTPSPLSVAIVGAGYIADYHVAALRAVPGVRIAAVCDLRESAAARFAASHGIGASYGDLGAMLNAETLDAVHVLTPPQAHVAPAAQALRAGVDVLLEKPLAHTLAGCEELAHAAREGRAQLGISHNFLFTKPYERLVADVESGRLGHVDQIDVVWNKELGQLKGGPFSAFMLADPRNILFEVAPHSFAHALHLTSVGPRAAGVVDAAAWDDLSVDARDEVALPRGLRFFRRWEIRGWLGKTSVRLRFGFDAGYPEHYVHVHGSNGTGHVDFENNTYVRQEHTPYLLDIDRMVNVARGAESAVRQAGATLGRVVLAKAGLPFAAGPFAESIARAVGAFYATRTDALDTRLGLPLAHATVALAERIAERVAEQAGLGEARSASAPAAKTGTTAGARKVATARRPDTLVVGGTGFIGRALVRRLVESGVSVRVLARDPAGAPPELQRPEVECVRGDFTDLGSVVPALEGIQHVYHLARGYGNTWDEYLRWDVAPTRAFAEACAKAGVSRFFYASSIAIYYAGARASVITEETAPLEDMLAANPYARSKAENERVLRELMRDAGLPLTIFRPGIVLGAGGPPLHWGIAAWPYASVCRLYGSGDHPLPIVLVDDVADAMVAARTAEEVLGKSYNLTAEACITASEYLDEVERHAGVSIRRVPVSAPRAFVTAWSKYAIKALGGDPRALQPSYADCEGRSFAATFDCSKAARELGWLPEQRRERLVAEGIHRPVEEHFELAPATAGDAHVASLDAAARTRKASADELRATNPGLERAPSPHGERRRARAASGARTRRTSEKRP
ncbi:MAG: NAD-dependent epimerase/dehydratase family protein [Polyangiales bacterium]|nr:NAD-dependent epimerase/dehydratase family protein [Myxococcales bacterium]